MIDFLVNFNFLDTGHDFGVDGKVLDLVHADSGGGIDICDDHTAT
jgi:hypothetical protein